jgi:DNA-binding CsgD family transcriptional regulator
MDIETLDPLIAAIYESALAPETWDDTVRKVIDTLGLKDWPTCGSLMEQCTTTHRVRYLGTHGIDEHELDAYTEAFAPHNPLTPMLFARPVGDVLDSDELIPLPLLKQTDFYRDFMMPAGIDRFAGVYVDRSASRNLVLWMAAPERWDPRPAVRGLRIIAPHIQRAVRISRRLGEAELLRNGATEALERAPSAVFMLTNDLSLIQCNGKGAELIASGIVKLVNGKLVADDREAREALVGLSKSTEQRSAAFRIGQENGDEETLFLAMRIEPHRALTLEGLIEGTGILLMGSSAASNDASLVDPAWTAAWWGLTETESKLAAAISTGRTVEDCASDFDIVPDTVRWHLKRIFRKTGVTSQAQLAVLMARSPTNNGGVHAA